LVNVRTEADHYDRDYVGYGRNIPRVEWPDDARLALSIVVNYETGAEYNFADGDGRNEAIAELPGFADPTHRDLGVESVYEYASRAGVFRLLRLFDEYDVKTTFFAAAMALERNPEAADWLIASGHEPCAHGYRWNDADPGLDRDSLRELIRLAVESITRSCAGRRPVGWQSRRASVLTRELLVEEGGFIYDSNAWNDDLPYYAQVKSTPFLVVPYTLVYNDAKFFFGGVASPSDFMDYLRRAVDYYRDEGQTHPRMMSVGIHPRWMGQAARASVVKELIEYALDAGDVWIARREDIARWWMDKYPPSM
jgi:peptidoglycan/xylan/chitin deacetylase (PgdA/CDA1 family)